MKLKYLYSISAKPHRLLRKAGAAALLSLLAGCAAAPAAPIPALKYRTSDNGRQPNLLVLLRGLGAGNAVFAEEGIISEIRRRHLPFDVVAPDAHYGYYESQTFVARLKEDIIDPARREGYRQIWLAGFSMGGLGCLLYLREHPGDVDGVLLTSPFLGWRAILGEIRDAGGVAKWNKDSGDPEGPRAVWKWIKSHDFNAAPPVWLGYGKDDFVIADGPALLAAVLPEGHAFSVPGGHSIDTLKAIFLRHLDMLAAQGFIAASQ